jgi:hypothetical protein
MAKVEACWFERDTNDSRKPRYNRFRPKRLDPPACFRSEQARLIEVRDRRVPWKLWGPYLKRALLGNRSRGLFTVWYRLGVFSPRSRILKERRVAHWRDPSPFGSRHRRISAGIREARHSHGSRRSRGRLSVSARARLRRLTVLISTEARVEP